MYIIIYNYNSFLLKFINQNKYVWLNREQFLAIDDRNMLKALELGVPTDIYMSLTDPNWTPIL